MQAGRAKCVVVTGASSGIGRELAIGLAGPEQEMWLFGRDRERLGEAAAVCRGHGAEVTAVPLELSDIDACTAYLEGVFPAAKRVNEVYLCAAITMFGEMQDTYPEDWDSIYKTNLLSPVQWCRHFYKNMVSQGGGRIVLIGSLAAYAGYPTATAYATMKAGMLGLYRSLWYEGRAHHVDIHLVSPGFVDTAIYRKAVFRKTSYEKVRSQIASLGLGVMSAEESAKRILRSVRRGEHNFAFPAYASLMKWGAPRIPALVDGLHNKILKSFRQSSCK